MKVKHIYILSLLLTFFSCDSFLETPPLDQISDSQWWKKESEVKMMVNDCYNKFPDADAIVEADFKRSDNGMFRNGNSIGNGSFTAYDADVRKAWQYDNIARLNYVLEGLEKSKLIVSENVYKQSVAEVRFIRAYIYYYMLFHFGDVPLITKVLTVEESKQTSRQLRSEVLDFVISELDAVVNSFEVSDSPESGRVNKNVAYAFLARIYLYEGDYEKVLTHTKAVINSNKYELFRDFDNNSEKNSYEELFRPQSDGKNKEVILERQYLAPLFVHNLNRNCTYASSVYKGWIQTLPLQNLVDEYECIEGHAYHECESLNCQYVAERQAIENNGKHGEYEFRDPRLKGTIITPGWEWKARGVVTSVYGIEDPISKDYIKNEPHSTGYLLTKWIDLEGEEPDRIKAAKNITLIRYADVLLMHAEALIETNTNLAEVANILNDIRSRAKMPKNIVATNQADMRETLRHERRIETAFEGLRHFDIIRWQIGDKVQQARMYGFAMKNADTNVRENIFMEERIWKKHMYLWPIPQGARDVNPNLSQNKDW